MIDAQTYAYNYKTSKIVNVKPVSLSLGERFENEWFPFMYCFHCMLLYLISCSHKAGQVKADLECKCNQWRCYLEGNFLGSKGWLSWKRNDCVREFLNSDSSIEPRHPQFPVMKRSRKCYHLCVTVMKVRIWLAEAYTEKLKSFGESKHFLSCRVL